MNALHAESSRLESCARKQSGGKMNGFDHTSVVTYVDFISPQLCYVSVILYIS